VLLDVLAVLALLAQLLEVLAAFVLLAGLLLDQLLEDDDDVEFAFQLAGFLPVLVLEAGFHDLA